MREKLGVALSSASRVGPTIAANAAISALGLGTGIILARVLGPANRGDAAAAIQWGTVAVTLGDFGIGFAMAYFVGTAPQRREELWGFGIFLAMTWGVLLACLGAALVPAYVQPGARNGLRLAFMAIPPGLLAGYQGYLLLGANRIGAYNFSRLSGTFVYASVVLFGVAKFRTVEMVALGFLASSVTSAAISALLLGRQGRPKLSLEREFLEDVVVFGAKTQIASIAANATLRLDQLLLSIVAVSAELGQYAVAVAVAGAISPLYSSLAAIVIPAVLREAKSGRGAEEALKYTRWALAASIPVVIVGIVVMGLVVRLAFGDDFSSAVLPARILLIAGVFQGVNAILGNALRGLGKPAAAAIAEGWGVIATVGLLAMLLRPFGIVGASAASLAAYAIVSAVLLFYMIRAGRTRSEVASIDSITRGQTGPRP